MQDRHGWREVRGEEEEEGKYSQARILRDILGWWFAPATSCEDGLLSEPPSNLALFISGDVWRASEKTGFAEGGFAETLQRDGDGDEPLCWLVGVWRAETRLPMLHRETLARGGGQVAAGGWCTYAQCGARFVIVRVPTVWYKASYLCALGQLSVWYFGAWLLRGIPTISYAIFPLSSDIRALMDTGRAVFHPPPMLCIYRHPLPMRGSWGRQFGRNMAMK